MMSKRFHVLVECRSDMPRCRDAEMPNDAALLKEVDGEGGRTGTIRHPDGSGRGSDRERPTARKLLSRPPHRGRSERGSANGDN